ncbi:MAG: RNase J family beta-CASP ribonuclease, partial [Oscillospiraceae bacterium]
MNEQSNAAPRGNGQINAGKKKTTAAAPQAATPQAKAPQAATQQAKAPQAAAKPQGQRGYYRGKRQTTAAKKQPSVPVRIMPLGGLGEVGKNITLYECQGDMILVDCGLVFPDSDMFGIDLVIPDFAYVIQN